MKLTLAILLLGVIVGANAGIFFAGSAASTSPSTFYQALLEQQLQEILATPGFPEDLQQRAIDTVDNAIVGFAECDAAANTLPWVQRVCVVRHYSTARAALTVIENEAAARAQTSTIASESVAAK